MSLTSVTAADVAVWRQWLRARLGTASRVSRAPPPLLARVLPGSHTDVRDRLERLLETAAEQGLISAEQVQAWRHSARLAGTGTGQAALASRFGVTARTVRAWISRVDHLLAEVLTGDQIQPAPPQGHGRPPADPVDVGAALAQVSQEFASRGATIEQLEAVQAFAADRLGGPRPRRAGARRWIRKRAYDTIQERLDIILHRPASVLPLALSRDGQSIIESSESGPEDAATLTAELGATWERRDRAAVPLMARRTLRALAAAPDTPLDDWIHVLAIITNALRDAENLQAMTFARLWRQLAWHDGGPRDCRAWMAHGVMIHMLEIHGHVKVAAEAQRRHIEMFPHLDFSKGSDRAWHQQDRLARLISIELLAGLPGGLRRAEGAVRQMRLIQDAGIADLNEAHAAVRRRRIEVRLARVLADGRGQAIGADPHLDPLVTELEQALATTAGSRSLSELDLLIRLDIARRDWPALDTHIGWAQQTAQQPDAPANLVERINRRLHKAAQHRLPAQRLDPVSNDPFRDERFLPPPMRRPT